MKRLPAAAKVVLAVAIAVGIGLCVRQWIAGTKRVAGTSMMDTLCPGDVALITRLDYRFGNTPRRGDVVECRFPGRDGTFIKRVVGLPGEAVECFGGAVTVDGRVIDEPYVSSVTGDFQTLLGADEYLVLGDNRAESYDSRMEDMGPIGPNDVLGRVHLVIWPPERFGRVE